MAVIVSHLTALQALRRGAGLAPLASQGLAGALREDSAAPRLPSPRPEELWAARNLLVWSGLLDGGQPMDVMRLPWQTAVFREGLVQHRWSVAGLLPVFRMLVTPGVAGEPRLLVPPPELLFLQLARQCALTTTLMLGWELCGHYAKLTERDQRTRGTSQGFIGRDPLCTKAEIDALLARMPRGVPGSARARRAARLVRDRSRSPMETAVALMLFAPQRLGGFGMPEPVVNGTVELQPRRDALMRSRLELDLHWLDPLRVTEYNGFDFHEGKSKAQAAKDAIRHNELEIRQIPHLTLVGSEVMDRLRFQLNARNIAQMLNHRLRLETRDWNQRYERFHADLLGLDYTPPEAYERL